MFISILLLFSLLGIYFLYNYRVEEIEEYNHELKPINADNKKQVLPPLNTIQNKKFYNIVRNIRKQRRKEIFIPIGDKMISLEKISSLLIVGQTGSGKSILIDNIICSTLMNYTESEVKLGLIDTNEVEFEKYKGINHIIESSSDIELIKRIDREVDIRKQLLKKNHFSTIKEYNRKNKKNPMSKILLIIDDLYDFRDYDFSNIIQSNVGVYLLLVTDFQEDKFNLPKIFFTGIGKFNFEGSDFNSIEIPDEDIENIVNYYKKYDIIG